MNERRVLLGSPRTAVDGCRRYRPIVVAYDTRNTVLDVDVKDEWEDEIKAMWVENHKVVRDGLLEEFGRIGGDEKLENYRAMGPEPWTVAFEHTLMLRQVRASFTVGAFYPALVGAVALGERLLHELVHVLRSDYREHNATTKRVAKQNLGTNWGALIDVLRGWKVLDDASAVTYGELERLRHDSVHFKPRTAEQVREDALQAVTELQDIILQIFGTHGGPPRFIAGIAGGNFLTLEAEAEPLVRRVFLPNSVLLSPRHRFDFAEHEPGNFLAYDDADFEPSDLTDAEFAEAMGASVPNSA